MAADPQHGTPGPGEIGSSAVTCEGVTVRFGDFTAVEDVSASWETGRVHAIVGQNGAGKTTLSRVLGGMTRPLRGQVRVGGRPLESGDVPHARRLGVELVHQHFALPPSFTVSEAFELFNTGSRRGGAFRLRRLHDETARQLREAGITASPRARLNRQSVETLQALEITRALASRPRVLILDEPTAVLSPSAVTRLFERLKALAAQGICVIVVLHKLREVFAVAETIAVLRDGRLVLPPTPRDALDQDELSALIVGADRTGGPETRSKIRSAPVPAGAAPRLVLTGASAASAGHDAPAESLDLVVASGEIVGVAGVEGNGQRSLAELIAGVIPVTEGTVRIEGRDVTGVSVRDRRSCGLRTIPFDRNVEGVSLSSSIWENHAVLRQRGDRWLLSPQRLRRRCRESLKRWNVRYQSDAEEIGNLSGGNVQRVVLARELEDGVAFLLAAHPTRGLDIGATRFVQEALAKAAAGGTGVLLISADLDELFELSHRIVVLFGGRIAREFTPPYDLARIGRAMTGGAA
jgi:general nucleoside transport system ATP-binding protein